MRITFDQCREVRRRVAPIHKDCQKLVELVGEEVLEGCVLLGLAILSEICHQVGFAVLAAADEVV